MGMENPLPVGWINFPSPIGMGLVKVPVMTPITEVYSSDPNLTGWTFILVSGATLSVRSSPDFHNLVRAWSRAFHLWRDLFMLISKSLS